MLSVIDVIKSLTILIEQNFPNYPVNDRDLEEGFVRPSYFIDVEKVEGSNTTAEYVRESADLAVYFFAEDMYQGFLDLLKVKNVLLDLLNKPIKIGEDKTAHVTFDNVNVEIDKKDKALTCTMSYELFQQREEDAGYMIEEIKVNVRKEVN